MLAWENLNVDFSATGKLVLFSSPQTFAAAQKQILMQRELGCLQDAVSADRCIEIEPALVSYQPHIAGATYAPSVALPIARKHAADCLRFYKRAACGLCWIRPSSNCALKLAQWLPSKRRLAKSRRIST